MSRIRSIHPGLWSDESFMSLSPLARLLYIGLWNEAFDDGVFAWKPQTLKAKIFPGDGALDMPALLAELIAADCIAERQDEKHYGLIRNFRTYQRPKKPNSSGMLQPDDRKYVGLVGNQFGTSTEIAEQMEDVGGRVEEEIQTPPPVLESGARAFDEVWEVFPCNPSSIEAKAKRLFDAMKPADRADLLKAAQRYRTWFQAECVARDRTEDAGLRFVPHLSTWIESGGWKAAGELPIKGELSPDLVVIKAGSAEFAAVEKLRGKKLYVGDKGLATVAKAEVERATDHAA